MPSSPLIKYFEEDAQYRIIQHNIRNIQILTKLQMQFIKTLPHESKNELFEIYNDCIRLFNDIMEE